MKLKCTEPQYKKKNAELPSTVIEYSSKRVTIALDLRTATLIFIRNDLPTQ